MNLELCGSKLAAGEMEDATFGRQTHRAAAKAGRAPPPSPLSGDTQVAIEGPLGGKINLEDLIQANGILYFILQGIQRGPFSGLLVAPAPLVPLFKANGRHSFILHLACPCDMATGCFHFPCPPTMRQLAPGQTRRHKYPPGIAAINRRPRSSVQLDDQSRFLLVQPSACPTTPGPSTQAGTSTWDG